ncbi:MAG: carbonic anhydrase [Gammaproteobacteria bacterium]|nr:carbonic anhydrase [Gammaproteobacteria bacterium]MDH5346044.1 carbonic anhydrase [Gammaproteobacteria bacterium]
MNRARVPAAEALARLREGNERFVAADRCIDTYLSHTKLDAHLEGQAPHAIILGCSDSRVPVEIIFDAGIGDMFVIRVAGNIVAPSLIGSIEFAAENFGSRLVVVLGHSGCGAVDATLKSLGKPARGTSTNVYSIIEAIRPSIEPLRSKFKDEATLLQNAVRANVSASVASLRHGSATLERLIDEDGLMIVGAEYSLETGEVDFFEGEQTSDPAGLPT